jgi:hypothetical protein
MTNNESTGLSETPEVAAPQPTERDVATTSFDEDMTIARDIMRQRRTLLRELAK